MKRILSLCAVLFFLCGCAAGGVSGGPSDSVSESIPATGSPGTPAAVSASAADSAPEGNPNPIPALKDVTADKLDALWWWCEELSNGGMWEVWGDQRTIMLEALKDIQLLDVGSADGKVPRLKYDIHVKNSEPFSILFIGDCVEVDGTLFHYKDYSERGYPDEVYTIHISNPAFDFQSVYEDPADIGALMKVLKTTPCPPPTELDRHTRDMFTLWIDCAGYDYNKQYKAIRTDDGRYILKRFFTLDVCLGELDDTAFRKLKLAEDDQFGTHCHCTVTSGGETIHPPGVLADFKTYDSGVWSSLDASPDISAYTDLLQTVTLADDLSVWIKDADSIWYKINLPDGGASEGDVLNPVSFITAPAGIYQVEVYAKTNGKYIENYNETEFSTYVYYFLVKIP
jgi:hypothetical protein